MRIGVMLIDKEQKEICSTRNGLFEAHFGGVMIFLRSSIPNVWFIGWLSSIYLHGLST